MAETGKSAVVLGATGLVGSRLVRRLANDARYARVTALVRRPTQLPAGVIAEIVDFERLDRRAELFAADHVFCALGTTIRKAGSQEAFRRVDRDYVATAARLAAQERAQVFAVISSIGADPASRNFYLRTKGEAEEAAASSGVPAVHIFQPSLLIGHREESRPFERLGAVAMQVFNPFMIGPLRPYRAVPADRVAAAMVEAAFSGDEGVRRHRFG